MVRGVMLDRKEKWGVIWLVAPESIIQGLFSTLEKLQASILLVLQLDLRIRLAKLAEPGLISWAAGETFDCWRRFKSCSNGSLVM